MVETLTCIPEWCAQEDSHDETCPEHGMTMTKADFAAAAKGGARAAIATYRFLCDKENFTHKQAVEQAVDEANEAAVCFAGIGSCGRGWCKHG